MQFEISAVFELLKFERPKFDCNWNIYESGVKPQPPLKHNKIIAFRKKYIFTFS